MKTIVIDLRLFGAKDSGLGRYNEQLLTAIVEKKPVDRYILLVSERLHLDLPSNFEQKIVKYRWYSLSEQLFLPALLRKLQADIVHFTHFNVPIFYKSAFIVTVHDLVMHHFADRSTTTRSRLVFWLKRLAYKVVIKHAVSNSKKIIAVSEFVKQDIVANYAIPADKITVIYEGPSKLPSVEFDLSIPEQYLLYVGNAYPHKNLPVLVEAFASVAETRPDLKLVLVGRRSFFYERLLQSIPDSLKSRIIFFDSVTDAQLPHFYKKADALVFPSLYEGFGLPALEALSYDCPVVAAEAGSLPEIIGQGALYFDPSSSASCAEQIVKILSDSAVRKKVIAKGKETLIKYSWNLTADNTLSLYQNLL